MSEQNHTPAESEMPHVTVQASEPEFYEEPPRMTAADIAGVIVALLALALIGFGGYVWLNPELEFSKLREQLFAKPAFISAEPAVSGDAGNGTTEDTAAAAAGSQDLSVTSDAESGEQAAAMPAGSEEVSDRKDSSCAFCGMFTDQTLGLVVASWSDGTVTHHDAWSCLSNYEKDAGLTLSSAVVLDYSSGLDKRQELDARTASYLFGVTKLDGSMPPFVAAFNDKAGAEEAQRELGGELVDFAGLQGKLP